MDEKEDFCERIQEGKDVMPLLDVQHVINVISSFKKNGSAVLLITHREEIAKIADKASQVCYGRIICSGTPEKVAEHYKARQCRVCNKVECHYV